MGEKQFVSARVEGGVVIADVVTHSLSEYESKLVQHDVMEVVGKAAGPAAHNILLDCTKVSFLASAGIGMMIAMRKHCMEGGGQLVVCGLGQDIMEALRLTRVDKLLRIENDRTAALKRLS